MALSPPPTMAMKLPILVPMVTLKIAMTIAPMMPTLTISARFSDYYIASDELGRGRSSAQQISMGSRLQITDYTKLRLEGRFSIGQMENDTLKLTGRTYLAVLQASI